MTTIPTINPVVAVKFICVEPDAVDPVVVEEAVQLAVKVGRAYAEVAVAAEEDPATAWNCAVPTDNEPEVAVARALASAGSNSVGAIVNAPTRAATAARRTFLKVHHLRSFHCYPVT